MSFSSLADNWPLGRNLISSKRVNYRELYIAYPLRSGSHFEKDLKQNPVYMVKVIKDIVIKIHFFYLPQNKSREKLLSSAINFSILIRIQSFPATLLFFLSAKKNWHKSSHLRVSFHFFFAFIVNREQSILIKILFA